MSIQGLAVDSDVESTNTDTLGGTFIKPTGLYPMIVDMAYLGKSSKGAMSLNLHLKTEDNSVVRQTLWITSGDKKGNKNFYLTKEGKKRLLPGMVLGNQISAITADSLMGAMTPEEKTIKLWDYESQAEKPTKVPCLTEMIGQPILVALTKIRSNKVKMDSNGKYINQVEERFFNEIDKVFYADGFSVTEKAAEADEALFHQKWTDKYDSEFVNDKYQEVEGTSDDSLPEVEASTGSLFPDAA